jgi:hypothetical protein
MSLAVCMSRCPPDHALPLIRVGAPTGETCEDRLLRLLDLQEQRIVIRVAKCQHERVVGADAAHADDLAGPVDNAVALEEHAPVIRKRTAITVHRERCGGAALRGKVLDQRWGIDDAKLAFDRLGQLVERSEAGGLTRLAQHVGFESARLGPADQREQLVHRHVCVPDLEGPHPGARTHSSAVCRRCRPCGLIALFGREATLASGDHHARCQAFDIPLEWRRQRLIEVVDIEDEPALGRGEDAEVQHVRIATRLYPQPADGSVGKILSHDRGGSAEERQRRSHHALMADRQELRHPPSLLLLQNEDRITPAGRRVPSRMLGARHALAQRPAMLPPAFRC